MTNQEMKERVEAAKEELRQLGHDPDKFTFPNLEDELDGLTFALYMIKRHRR